MIRRSVVAGAVVALFACGSAFAQAVPKEMAWTAYDTGSSGFNIAVAIGQQFKQAYGSDVRILPSGNDTGRLSPVKANRAVISQMGIGTYFAQEGVFEFGTKSWGPQPARLMMSATACNGLGLAVAKDTGVKEVKDIKGKRVGVVVGSPALTQGVLALIAFAGPDREGRHAGAVLVQQRDVEGHHQQRGRRRAELDDLGPVQGSRQLAARHHLAAHAGRRQGGLGAGPQEGALLRAGEGDLRLGRALAADPDHHGGLRLSDLHDLRRPAGRHDRTPSPRA